MGALEDMFGSGKPAIEPSSMVRSAATEMRAAYLAIIESGFTQAEAMELLKAMITPAKPGGQQ